MRLICGYSTSDGYVVERERGGRGYNIGKIVFDKTKAGYTERRVRLPQSNAWRDGASRQPSGAPARPQLRYSL